MHEGPQHQDVMVLAKACIGCDLVTAQAKQSTGCAASPLWAC